MNNIENPNQIIKPVPPIENKSDENLTVPELRGAEEDPSVAIEKLASHDRSQIQEKEKRLKYFIQMIEAIIKNNQDTALAQCFAARLSEFKQRFHSIFTNHRPHNNDVDNTSMFLWGDDWFSELGYEFFISPFVRNNIVQLSNPQILKKNGCLLYSDNQDDFFSIEETNIRRQKIFSDFEKFGIKIYDIRGDTKYADLDKATKEHVRVVSEYTEGEAIIRNPRMLPMTFDGKKSIDAEVVIGGKIKIPENPAEVENLSENEMVSLLSNQYRLISDFYKKMNIKVPMLDPQWSISNHMVRGDLNDQKKILIYYIALQKTTDGLPIKEKELIPDNPDELKKLTNDEINTIFLHNAADIVGYFEWKKKFDIKQYIYKNDVESTTKKTELLAEYINYLLDLKEKERLNRLQWEENRRAEEERNKPKGLLTRLFKKR